MSDPIDVKAMAGFEPLMNSYADGVSKMQAFASELQTMSKESMDPNDAADGKN